MKHIIGINAYHPDSSVAYLQDGNLVWAAEEERFNRIKHASGFPVEALKHCFRENNLKPEDVDVVTLAKDPAANFMNKSMFVLKNKIDFKFLAKRVRLVKKSSDFKNDYLQALGIKSSVKTKFIHVEHHKAHVASAFFASGFDRAAFLSFDGMGDFSSAMWGLGDGTKINILEKICFPHSAGFFYTAATQFLGFHHFGDEYKVMGLAAYGKPSYMEQCEQLIHLKPNGKFELNLDYFVHHLGKAGINWTNGYPEQDLIFSKKWEELFGAPRKPKTELTTRDKDIAASLQKRLEIVYFHILNHLYEKTKEPFLCLAGGVALNSLANGKITKNTPFKKVFIQPAAGDAGTSLGSALYYYHCMANQPRTFVMKHAYYGSKFSRMEIEEAIKKKGLLHRNVEKDELIQVVTRALGEGKIIGWFQDGMEYGPRALGARSILADPTNKQMKDILNERIKKRENFRPFAPIVPADDAHEFFEMDCDETPFMLKVFPVKKDKRELLPSITHLDGTARIQTVSKETNALLYQLLKEMKHVTGVPILINTSFNENEPIVCNPDDAINCFLKTKMDLLILGNSIVEK